MSTDDEFAGATGPYQSGPFDFKAVAYFDRKSSRLSSVLLYLKDVDQAFRLQDELKVKYGRPASNMDVSVTRTTVWLTDTEKVEFSLIYKALVSVKYQPRLTASNKGPADELIAAACRAQADALEIEATALPAKKRNHSARRNRVTSLSLLRIPDNDGGRPWIAST